MQFSTGARSAPGELRRQSHNQQLPLFDSTVPHRRNGPAPFIGDSRQQDDVHSPAFPYHASPSPRRSGHSRARLEQPTAAEAVSPHAFAAAERGKVAPLEYLAARFDAETLQI